MHVYHYNLNLLFKHASIKKQHASIKYFCRPKFQNKASFQRCTLTDTHMFTSYIMMSVGLSQELPCWMDLIQW